MGSKVTYSHDVYVWYGDSCVYDKTVKDSGLNDIILKAPNKDDKADDKICKYTLLFKTTCSASDPCTDADRTVLFYTFEDRTPVRDWFTSMSSSLFLIATQLYFFPIASIMAILGRFGFMQ